MTARTLTLSGGALALAAVAYLLGYQTGRNRGHVDMVASRPVQTPPAPAEALPAAAPVATPAAALPPVAAAPTPPTVAPVPVPASGLAPAKAVVSPYATVHVLVVGTNHGGAGRAQLVYAEQEAEDIARLFDGREDHKVTRLIGKDATGAAIRGQLKRTLPALGANDDFIFFFAGHGATLEPEKATGVVPPEKLKLALKRTGLLLAYDAAPATAGKQEQIDAALVAADLIAQLKDSPGRHRLALLSSCFSGWAADVDGKGSSENFATPNLERSNPLAHRTVQVMTASLATERTFEIPELKGSAFTGALRAQLAEEKSQRVLTVFATVDDMLRTQKKYQPPDGRGSQPQLRSYQSSAGDFYFIPPARYAEWSAPDALGVGTGPAAMYAQDVTPEEAQAEIKNFQPAAAEAASPARPVLPAEKIARYEARAAVGDPQAMAILTEYYGRSLEAKDRARSYNYAYAAYETGDQHGKFALGRAYSQGFGVEKSDDLGRTLIESSGLKDLIAMLVVAQSVRNDLTALQNASSPVEKANIAMALVSKAGPALTAVKGLFSRLRIPFLRDPTAKAYDNLKAARKALEAPKADILEAKKRFATIRKDITDAERVPDDQKKLILDGIDAIDAVCSDKSPDISAALKLIDAMIQSSGSPPKPAG